MPPTRRAAPQPVIVVTHCAQHGSSFDLTRAAYHLGNRHVPLELKPDHLKLEPDHVLADLLRQMHLTVTSTEAPFEPENGAYAPAGAAAHDHAHGHAHESGQAHDHDQGQHSGSGSENPLPITASPTAPHVHGPGCKHDH